MATLPGFSPPPLSYLFSFYFDFGPVQFILGDPGSVSGVDKMSVVKVYCKIETSPGALTLAEPVPEAFELPVSEEQPVDSDVF